jgi:class 3 adenylate cyclase
MHNSLKQHYKEALIASGLVDDVPDYMALDPLPSRLTEGDFLCRHGDKADRLWVIVSGSVAVRDDDRTLHVRLRPDVVGEQNIISDESFRWYDLVANESQVEVLTIHKEQIERHPQVGVLWRNIAKIISLKLKTATVQTADLLEQVQDDSQILRAYTNEYALSRRLRSGNRYLTDHRLENAIIWFSDIVNFTRFALDLSPVRTADLVQRFFNAQAEAIERHSGYIDKFMGDGLMAFWILSSDEAAARRKACEDALVAAEEAVRSVAQIHIGAEPLELRVGLHVGPVLSGDFGSAHRHQFTLIGSAVNKAARLEQIHPEETSANPDRLGRIRISAEFHDALSERTGQKYAQRSSAVVKNLGQVVLFSQKK